MLTSQDINTLITLALREDIGGGDITAGLLPEQQISRAVIISKHHEQAVICGTQFVDAIYQQLDKSITINWMLRDGNVIENKQTLCILHGPTRALLTGERSALNFLQTLSGTATLTQKYAAEIKGTKAKLLDTRKTLPGMRAAQKYAVTCGGGYNHRFGLYDAILIKENHIAAAGSLTKAVDLARTKYPDITIEVEVRNLHELEEALKLGKNMIDRIMLDNFNIDDTAKAVLINKGTIALESSGGITLQNISSYAATGVDYISIGAITKTLLPIDFSMLVTVVE